jgi:DNA-binding response OmpR family regulator
MPIDRDVARTRQRLVILVDANEESRLVCRAALSEAGFEVITATDVPTALLVAQLVPPDVLLVDIDPPTLSSLLLARDIRSEGRLHDSQIIALSVEDSPRNRVEHHATRFDMVIAKPADQQRLLEAVGTSLVPV